MNSLGNIFYIQYRRLFRPLIKNGHIFFNGIADWFVFSLIVLPTYFGIRLAFFDLTALRFFEVLLLIGIFKNSVRRDAFISLIKKCKNNIYICMYLFVVVYTNIVKFSLNAIFYWLTNVICVIYLIAYLVVYEYGIEKFLEKAKRCFWIIVTISPLELFLGVTPFSLLDTLGKAGSNSRFGTVRILGNCSTTNGYAMFLMIWLPLFCYDWKKKKIDLGKNKILLGLFVLNIFLTGSRLTIGTLILGLFLCVIVQPRKQLKHTLIIIILGIPVIGLILYSFRNVNAVQGIIRTFLSAVDEVLNTNYAVNFGGEQQTLYNSTYYRELLWKNTILGDWLNPWIGKGGSYKLSMYIEGYRINSVDNFYVGQYVAYGYPGLFTWMLMSLSFFFSMFISFIRKNIFAYTMMVSFICYYIALWYLDQLQTFSSMAIVFGLAYGVKILRKENSVGKI